MRTPMPSTPKPAVVLVAHGQPSAPDTGEAALAAIASGVARHLPGYDVRSATLASAEVLERQLEGSGDAPRIYPLFMTRGWFLKTALTKRLGDRDLTILPPFGAERGLPALAARVLSRALQARSWTAGETVLLLASHGSGSGRPGPSRDTRAFADVLHQKLHFAEVRVGYIEEDPFLKDAACGLPGQSLCLPFFAAQGGHVEIDIPEALQEADFKGVLLPPIGADPDVPGMIARAIAAYDPAKTDP